MSEPKQKLKSAAGSKLPMASVIDDTDTFKHTVKLLKEVVSLVSKQSEMAEREKEIREELAAICAACNLEGVKHGKCGFEYHGYTTRKTLSKERLLASGVSAEIIEAAYQEGTPYLYSRIVAFDID